MEKISLNKGQQECLDKLYNWWKNEKSYKQLFEIAGLAGCGKTFVIRYLIDIIPDLKLENVLFVAFVGKAAMQMGKNGLNASTIHSAIYVPIEKDKVDENGNIVLKEGRVVKEIKFIKKPNLDKKIKLIVIDEAPMVDEKLARDLMNYGLPIIALGDRHQLPPVIGKSFFLKKPDHELTEIVRQKEGNPILDLAMDIISNPNFKLKPMNKKGKLLVIKKKDFLNLAINLLPKADIVICGYNTTRNNLNELIRSLYFKDKGLTGKLPELLVGDKVICRKNNWNKCIDNIYLINGLVGNVKEIHYEDKKGDLLPIDFKVDFLSSSFTDLGINMRYFTGNPKTKELIKHINHDGELFEYGYAITCHLSQGSQYNNVIVFVERMGSEENFRKWLYTAVTRSSDKLILVI